MNKTATWTIVLVILLAGLGTLIYMNGKNAPVVETVPTNDMSVMPNDTGTTTDTGAQASTTVNTAPVVKEFTVSGKSFSFTPNTLAVKKGDTVKITFKNTGGTHNFVIDEFNVATKKIASGQEETVTFVADKAGQFEYYCSVGTHRANGMKGTLTVTE